MGEHWHEESPSSGTDISIWLSTFISGGYHMPVLQMIELVSVELTWFTQEREDSKYEGWKSGLQNLLGFIFPKTHPWGTKAQLSPPLVSLQRFHSLPSSLPFPSVLLQSQALLKLLTSKRTEGLKRWLRPSSFPEGYRSLLGEVTIYLSNFEFVGTALAGSYPCGFSRKRNILAHTHCKVRMSFKLQA